MKTTTHISIFCLLALFLLAWPKNAFAIVVQDLVLRSDTVWSGEVLIDGVVVIGRSATLKILPGTTVRFKRVDRNHDGIGDGEIRVLGRLLAIGNADRPIRFESAELLPSREDWSYVLIFTSGKKSHVQYCEFSHGFTGLQIHFSTAAVSDSLFVNNHEGLRFGRARLSVEHCVFNDNDIGIRFTRMEGPVVISHNEITRNRQGIFLVPSGQNIQDFFEPDRSGRPWNTGRLTISDNNIDNNSSYNLNLGEKQSWDLDVANNWWGTRKATAIEEKIFDRNRDSSLGKALYEPIICKPVPQAGIRR